MVKVESVPARSATGGRERAVSPSSAHAEDSEGSNEMITSPGRTPRANKPPKTSEPVDMTGLTDEELAAMANANKAWETPTTADATKEEK